MTRIAAPPSSSAQPTSPEAELGGERLEPDTEKWTEARLSKWSRSANMQWSVRSELLKDIRPSAAPEKSNRLNRLIILHGDTKDEPEVYDKTIWLFNGKLRWVDQKDLLQKSFIMIRWPLRTEHYSPLH